MRLPQQMSPWFPLPCDFLSLRGLADPKWAGDRRRDSGYNSGQSAVARTRRRNHRFSAAAPSHANDVRRKPVMPLTRTGCPHTGIRSTVAGGSSGAYKTDHIEYAPPSSGAGRYALWLRSSYQEERFMERRGENQSCIAAGCSSPPDS